MTKSKIKVGRGRKVWHITDFRRIFELSDDLRKKRPGPLTYTKSPVTLTAGSKDHDIKIWERLQQLKSRPERHLLRSVFEDLKCWAGLKTIKDRGYLVTTEGLPASYEYIAGQLKLKVDEVKQAMTLLEEIGLLERLTLKSKKPPDKSGRSRTKPAKSGRSRTKPDSTGKKRKPLKKVKKNDKGNSKGIKKRQGSKDKSNNIKVPPPTTQPIKPQVSAKRGRVVQFTAPSKLQNTELLGDIAKGIMHRYNPDAKSFGADIYIALDLPFEPNSTECRRELGCFASAWQKSGRGDKLRKRAIFEARKIAKREKNRNKGAVWCTVFKNLENAYSRRKLNETSST